MLHRPVSWQRSRKSGTGDRPETLNRFLECKGRLFRGKGTKNLYYAAPKSALSTEKER